MGSVIPLTFGMSMALSFGHSIQSAIAIGSCFAPTSMGIALNVLKKAKILNTPTGQLIIAAAILDDVMALIILTEIQALADPTPMAILLPLIVSPVLIVGIGYLAIRWIPRWTKSLMDKVPSLVSPPFCSESMPWESVPNLLHDGGLCLAANLVN